MKIKFLSDYSKNKSLSPSLTLLINYTAMELQTIKEAVKILEDIL